MGRKHKLLREHAAGTGQPRVHPAMPWLLLLLFAAAPAFAAADWENRVTAKKGPFPAPPSLSAQYRFGWSGLTAATADLQLRRTGTDRLQLSAKGGTVGLARALWRMDATYEAAVERDALAPLTIRQVENLRGKRLLTDLSFNRAGVVSARVETVNGKDSAKTRTFSFPGAHDLFSSLLFVRSQTLAPGSTTRVVVYPATSAYLATVTVVGRERLRVRAGSFDAIKVDLQLQKINKKRALEPHKKFKRATAWISDDANRMLLRVEGQIFVGTVFAELQSFQTNPKR